MKKSICLYFQVHQPTRLRLYRFFDIGKDSHYYDDFANRTILRRVADRCYLPMNAQLLEMIKAGKGKFKLAFSISGSFIEAYVCINLLLAQLFFLSVHRKGHGSHIFSVKLLI